MRAQRDAERQRESPQKLVLKGRGWLSKAALLAPPVLCGVKGLVGSPRWRLKMQSMNSTLRRSLARIVACSIRIQMTMVADE